MLSNKNTVVVASAGARKTTFIVEKAIEMKGKRVLLTTYTNENLDQIRKFITERCGHIPTHISLLSWFSFLLQEGVRPYQSYVTSENRRANSILFEDLKDWNRFTRKEDADKYFLTSNDDIYKDRVSDFVCRCEEASGGLVIRRLQMIYDSIFIDELQDMAGFDLEFLGRLFLSKIGITAVGDPRQGTFSTNNSAKNKQYKRSEIFEWLKIQQKSGLIKMITHNESYRCNQAICDFADQLFPEYPKTKSMNPKITGHDGIHKIKLADVEKYFSDYTPIVLRWNKGSDTMTLPAINIGISKGRTYDRVLIFPTKPMIEYLKTGDVGKAGDRSKFYVAVTRARYSVAFVVE